MEKLSRFLRAISSDWLARMSGPLTVPFAVAAFLLPSTAAKVSFASLAVTAALATCYRIWAMEFDRAQNASAKVRKIEEAKPGIRLNEPSAVYTESIDYAVVRNPADGGNFPVSTTFLKVRFVNDPLVPSPNSVAKGLRAYIDYFRLPADVLVLRIDGRWAETDQPSSKRPSESRASLLATELGIGEAKSVDVAYYDLFTNKYYAWNNDNYNYLDYVCPKHLLEGDRFRVKIRLRGEMIDYQVSFIFKAEEGGFAIEEVKE